MAEWIIIVDDDIMNLKSAGQILSKNHMRVTALRSGQALLEYLSGGEFPDLILLDVYMPGMDGFETLKRLREMEKGRAETPVIFLTASNDLDAEIRGLQLGAMDYIRKPFIPEVLAERIQRALRTQERMNSFEREAMADMAPGFPDRIPAEEMDLESITTILEERSAPSSAMWMGKEAFISIYRYMTRYMERYHGMAYRTLFTIRMADENCAPEDRAEVMAEFRKLMQGSLRNSDIMVEISDRQLFMLLPETREYNIGLVIGRLLEKWNRTEYSQKASIEYETGQVHLRGGEGNARQAGLVAVVDDDPVNLRFAERVLQKENIEAALFRSGAELLEYLKNNNPDLILLDIMMPGMSGFETIRRMRTDSLSARDIPVIFLTSDDSRETETEGLQLGAMDFIRKPFLPDVLNLRVRHAVELTRLQNNLAMEVKKKTHENNMLFFQIVRSMTEAIDAKDTYTKGHSGRVAEYAEMIAQRCGYTDEQLNRLYTMGLVHDVGKIGIPDAVINKPGKLNAEEYDIIKTHPVLGAKILGTVQEMPSLATGARWHHERYDGTGYPDGLAGEEIPEEARIIAVADAYDAMTSRRSYRNALPQESVRREIEKGRGSQFDPRFADVMLQLMDEDKEYRLREKTGG